MEDARSHVGSPLYAYSLVPVLAVATLLFLTAIFRGRATRGLGVYCLTVALWCAALLMIQLPATAHIGERCAASGAFIAAGYMHAAFAVTEQRSYKLVAVAWLVAAAITGIGLAWPGALYGPLAMERGPLFWPAMVVALGAAGVPSWQLLTAYREAVGQRRRIIRSLLLAGVLCAVGGMGNAILLSGGSALPYGILLVLASLLVLGDVIRAHEPAGQRRLIERSLLYAAITAFLSAGFMFGVLSLMSSAAQPLVGSYRIGALLLLAMAALAFEPMRLQIQSLLSRGLLRDHAGATDLAKALDASEARAEHAERLAEIGTLVSAVAHEVRNPLGVLSAHLKIMAMGGAEPDTVAEMQAQIDRATHFVEDLLRYGRPRPVEVRQVDLPATVELGYSTAKQGLGAAPPEVAAEFEQPEGRAGMIEGDQGQLSQVFVILFDNALLALMHHEDPQIRVRTTVDGGSATVTIDDNGDGIPAAIKARLFQPFVTGRKREGPRPGTGLGLATARGILERHGGGIEAEDGPLGGARLRLWLPVTRPRIVPEPPPGPDPT